MPEPSGEAPAKTGLSARNSNGTHVTAEALNMIERAETIVRAFGFRVFRVRHHVEAERPTARVEILPNEMPALAGIAEALRSALRGVGYDEVVIDPRGYRSPVA